MTAVKSSFIQNGNVQNYNYRKGTTWHNTIVCFKYNKINNDHHY